jgi:hypothetical protein
MKNFIITIEGKKFVLPADSWWHAYRTCMAGRDTVPRNFSIRPIRGERDTARHVKKGTRHVE